MPQDIPSIVTFPCVPCGIESYARKIDETSKRIEGVRKRPRPFCSLSVKSRSRTPALPAEAQNVTTAEVVGPDQLFTAAGTNHLYIGWVQVTVFGFVLLHARIGSRILRVFLQVVHLGMRYGSLDPYLVTDMGTQVDSVVAVHLPCATVLGSQQEFIRSVSFR